VEVFLLALSVVAVLLLVVFPALLYLIGWAVARIAKKSPSRIASPASPRALTEKPGRTAPAAGE
jgi:hypothetical protein